MHRSATSWRSLAENAKAKSSSPVQLFGGHLQRLIVLIGERFAEHPEKQKRKERRKRKSDEGSS